jgi:hypothetical protein
MFSKVENVKRKKRRRVGDISKKLGRKKVFIG